MCIASSSRRRYLSQFNPLTAGAVHIRFLHFLLAHYISAFDLNILKLKSDNNQQNFKFVDLHFVKDE